MARLFIAVWPPEDVVSELRSLHRKDQRGVRFIRPEDWHITLRFFGEAHPAEVADALAGAALPAAHVRLGPAVDVFAERVLMVPADGLDELAAAVIAPTARIGAPQRKRFVGHLTVARIKPNARMPRALGALTSAEFEVTEVALVQSRLDRAGARYEILRTWPCTAASGG